MTPIIIYPSHNRIALLFLGSIAFVAIGIWMVTLSSNEIGIKRTISAWICILFFGTIGVFTLTRLFSKKPALIIDQAGITDYASSLSAGFIPWSDITGAGIATFHKQKFLGISLRNPQDYLEKASLLKRLLMKSNSSWVGYIVNIPQITLPVAVEDLLVQVNQFKQAVG